VGIFVVLIFDVLYCTLSVCFVIAPMQNDFVWLKTVQIENMAHR